MALHTALTIRWYFIQNFSVLNQFFSTFSKFFLSNSCVIRLYSYANKLPHKTTEGFDACKKFAFFFPSYFKFLFPREIDWVVNYKAKFQHFPVNYVVKLLPQQRQTFELNDSSYRLNFHFPLYLRSNWTTINAYWMAEMQMGNEV